MSSRPIDLKNKVFGNFKVLEIDNEFEHNKGCYWKCECILCGRIKPYRSDVLRKRPPTTCGCNSNVIKIGDKYGYLETIELTNKLARSPYWKCKCVCGKIIERTSSSLRKNPMTSCGCKKNPSGINHPSYKGYKNITTGVFSQIINGALRRNLTFNITQLELQELLEKQEYKCALSGVEISLIYKNKTASLDRIDSNKGYEISNVQWVHKNINLMKNNLDQQEFINFCEMVANKNKRLRNIKMFLI